MPKHYRQLQVKDLPKVHKVAARARFEPTTLWSKGVISTNAPPRPTSLDFARNNISVMFFSQIKTVLFNTSFYNGNNYVIVSRYMYQVTVFHSLPARNGKALRFQKLSICIQRLNLVEFKDTFMTTVDDY